MRRILSVLLGIFYLYATKTYLALAYHNKGVFLGFINLPDQIMTLINFALVIVTIFCGIGLIFGLKYSWYVSLFYQLYALIYTIFNYNIFKETVLKQSDVLPENYCISQAARIILNILPFIILFLIKNLYTDKDQKSV